MKEKLESMKGFISEHKDECINVGVITAVAVWGFVCGRCSVTQHVETRVTYTDKDGLIVKEQFIGMIR